MLTSKPTTKQSVALKGVLSHLCDVKETKARAPYRTALLLGENGVGLPVTFHA